LLQSSAAVSCAGAATVWSSPITHIPGATISEKGQRTKLFDLAPQEVLKINAHANALELNRGAVTVLQAETMLRIVPNSDSSSICLHSLKRAGVAPRYHGQLLIIPAGPEKLHIILETDLESYIKGVLQSEIPASYHLEAIKAQAVTARTYALHPRINHNADHCNVCDSYLCCQYFAGLASISPSHEEAIAATAGQIVTDHDEPILALFSSCAGGHTESFENCFSDPESGAFPPAALPYLIGIPEGKLPAGYIAGNAPTEQAMRALWATAHPQTVDAWATQFRWALHIPAQLLESHMHHVVQTLLEAKDTAPFVIPPDSGKFGQIKSFSVAERGVAGTAIELVISTSTGQWKVKKELVIRSCFNTPDLHVARLRSARIFFDHHYDKLGLLSAVDIHGLGFGHGVGLQQTGSQGLAKSGSDYHAIVSHYFHNAKITAV